MNTTALPCIRLKVDRLPTHPWIFRRSLEEPQRLPPGTVADLVDGHGQFLARGFWNGHARIGFRVLTRQASEVIDTEFIQTRIAQAVELRRERLHLDTQSDAWRVLNSEADGLSGLIVDRYADLLVLEYFAAGMWRLREVIEAALRQAFPDCRFYHFAERHVQKQESFDCRPPQPPEPLWIHEHQLAFRVVPGSRHKTGFFLDQRDNRACLEAWAQGRVLDLCCNSGGFALHAARAGCDPVTGIDRDEASIKLARDNAQRNGLQAHFEQGDLFTYLEQAVQRGQQWDTVILDPARLTRDRARLPQALRAYVAMNRLALLAVAPGGLLLSCSCSGLVTTADFLECLRRAAALAERRLTVLHIAGAAADHPFAIDVPEGRYLQAVFCRVY